MNICKELCTPLFFSGAVLSAAAVIWCLVMWGKMHKYCTEAFNEYDKNDKSCPSCGVKLTGKKTEGFCSVCGAVISASPYEFVYDAREKTVIIAGFVLLGGILAASFLELTDLSGAYGLPEQTPVIVLFALPLLAAAVYAAARAYDLAKTPGLGKIFSAEEKENIQKIQNKWKHERADVLQSLALRADPKTFVFAVEKLYPSDISKRIDIFAQLKNERTGREKCAVLLFDSIKKDCGAGLMKKLAELKPGQPALKNIFSEMERTNTELIYFACSSDEETALCALECMKKINHLEEVSKKASLERIKQDAAVKYTKLKNDQDAKQEIRRMRQQEDCESDRKAAESAAKKAQLRSRVLHIKGIKVTKESQRDRLESKLNEAVYLVFEVQSYFDTTAAETMNEMLENIRAAKDNMKADHVSESIDKIMDMLLKFL